jgi:hypothetical protein
MVLQRGFEARDRGFAAITNYPLRSKNAPRLGVRGSRFPEE